MVETSSALRVALSPATSSANEFVNLFAAAITNSGYEVVSYNLGLRNNRDNDVVIFHWPDQFFSEKTTLSSIGELARLLLVKKVYGVKLIWVAHNLHPHNSAGGSSSVQKFFLKNLDGIIYLSKASRKMIRAQHDLPKSIIECVTVHGSYPGSIKPFRPPHPDDTVRLISFGQVRPYKNLDALVRASEQLDSNTTEVHIVGMRQDLNYANQLESAGKNSSSVHFDLRDDYLTGQELDSYLDTAHGVVLPYTKIMNSGAAIHALSRGKPVLVPAMGSMPELKEKIGERWVSLFDGEVTGKDLERFVENVRGIRPDTRPDMASLSWEKVSDDLSDCLDSILKK